MAMGKREAERTRHREAGSACRNVGPTGHEPRSRTVLVIECGLVAELVGLAGDEQVTRVVVVMSAGRVCCVLGRLESLQEIARQ